MKPNKTSVKRNKTKTSSGDSSLSSTCSGLALWNTEHGQKSSLITRGNDPMWVLGVTSAAYLGTVSGRMMEIEFLSTRLCLFSLVQNSGEVWMERGGIRCRPELLVQRERNMAFGTRQTWVCFLAEWLGARTWPFWSLAILPWGQEPQWNAVKNKQTTLEKDFINGNFCMNIRNILSLFFCKMKCVMRWRLLSN